MSLFDTSILIDCLKGLPQAVKEARAYEQPKVSIISFMEVLAGAPTKSHEISARALLSHFEVINVTSEISEAAIQIRRSKSMKFLDCIILATAVVEGTSVITRNTKDFKEGSPHVRIPYKV